MGFARQDSRFTTLRQTVSTRRKRADVRWVVDVLSVDLEKLWATVAKKKTDSRRVSRLRLQWQPTERMRPHPPNASTASEELRDEGDGTGLLSHWVMDGTLKLKDAEVCQSQLLWIFLHGPPVYSRRHKVSSEAKPLGKVYLDLANYTPGKCSKRVTLIGDMFDLVVRVQAMTQEENPDILGDGPSKSLDNTEGPQSGGLISDQEPQLHHPAVQKRWLHDERQKLQCELRRSMLELNRETMAALEEHEGKQKQLATLKKQQQELERRVEALQCTDAFEEKKATLKAQIQQSNARVMELEEEYDETEYQEQRRRRQQCCSCTVM